MMEKKIILLKPSLCFLFQRGLDIQRQHDNYFMSRIQQTHSDRMLP